MAVEMTLYNVRMIYGGDRNAPVIKSELGIVAKDADEAKLKAAQRGLVPEADWETDYITTLAVKIGTVKVRPLPRRVQNVA